MKPVRSDWFPAAGKPKILRSIVRNVNDQLGDNPWKKYDKIGFIDTNSISINGRKLFASSSSLLLWKDKNKRFAIIYHPDLLIGVCSENVNPERRAWADFIQRVQVSSMIKTGEKILIVVDSEKSSLSSINEEKEPVFGDFMLPDGFSITYATSDSGAESWINKEMKRRDKVSSILLTMIKTDTELLKLLDKRGYLYIKNNFE